MKMKRAGEGQPEGGAPRRRAGFTLVEMLVVLVIIMSLVGIVSVNVIRYQAKARVDAARIQLKQLQNGIRLYQTEQGRIPTEQQGLDALVEKPNAPPVPAQYPDQGYLESRHVPRDPWGNVYVYVVPGRDGLPFEILSYGRDGQPGGTGDAADLSTADF